MEAKASRWLILLLARASNHFFFFWDSIAFTHPFFFQPPTKAVPFLLNSSTVHLGGTRAAYPCTQSDMNIP